MKSRFFLFLLPILFFGCSTKKTGQYVVTGSISGIETGKVFLQSYEAGKWTGTDSAEIKNGEFTITGKLDMPEVRYLTIDGRNGFFQFFLENSKISIRANADSLDLALIRGSATEDKYIDFQKQVESLKKQTNEADQNYTKARNDNNKKLEIKFDSAYSSLDHEMTNRIREYILKNTKTVVSAYLVTSNFWRFELEDLQKFASSLNPSLDNSVYVKKIKERVDVLSKVQVGKPAVDFTQNDTSGTPVTLSSFKGKYVLVDFWASWCPDCRKENPNLVAMYKEFHPKGLEILGVSFDKSREKWIKAISEDQLTWHHVSDLQRWANEAGKLYAVASIPANVLIDKNGMIIAKNLYGDHLKEKLSELFK